MCAISPKNVKCESFSVFAIHRLTFPRVDKKLEIFKCDNDGAQPIILADARTIGKKLTTTLKLTCESGGGEEKKSKYNVKERQRAR